MKLETFAFQLPFFFVLFCFHENESYNLYRDGMSAQGKLLEYGERQDAETEIPSQRQLLQDQDKPTASVLLGKQISNAQESIKCQGRVNMLRTAVLLNRSVQK